MILGPGQLFTGLQDFQDKHIKSYQSWKSCNPVKYSPHEQNVSTFDNCLSPRFGVFNARAAVEQHPHRRVPVADGRYCRLRHFRIKRDQPRR